MYCRLEAGGWRTVSQYCQLYCDRQGLLGESRYKICIMTEAVGWLGAGLGVRKLGRAAGAGVGAGACAGRADGQAVGVQGLAERRACGRQAAGAGRQACSRQGAAGTRPRRWARGLGAQAGRAAWALGARPGRTSWPWAVHSVHSACFGPGSTWYFS